MMFNKRKKQIKLVKEQKEDIQKFLKDKEIKKILKDLSNNKNLEIIPLLTIKKQTTFFDWENDTDINPDFELWEKELITYDDNN
jgi:hypothetical protein